MEMEEINPEMPEADVALVLGANDVVNPAARHDKSSPIYGMPIIDADKAKTVFVIKRNMNPGSPASRTSSSSPTTRSCSSATPKAVFTNLVEAVKE